jgi:malate dehydrogenase
MTDLNSRAEHRLAHIAQQVVPTNSSPPQNMAKVCVAGASGGIGQPLSMFMKTSSRVGELALYDVAPMTYGVAADLGHINTASSVKGYVGPEQLPQALKGCNLVVIPAGDGGGAYLMGAADGGS